MELFKGASQEMKAQDKDVFLVVSFFCLLTPRMSALFAPRMLLVGVPEAVCLMRLALSTILL